MRTSPPLAPGHSCPLYFVLCDYGPNIGRAYAETDPDEADRETILNLLMKGEYHGPVQVLEVDLPNGTVRDMSVEFAEEILERTGRADLRPEVAVFVSRGPGLAHQKT